VRSSPDSGGQGSTECGGLCGHDHIGHSLGLSGGYQGSQEDSLLGLSHRCGVRFRQCIESELHDAGGFQVLGRIGVSISLFFFITNYFNVKLLIFNRVNGPAAVLFTYLTEMHGPKHRSSVLMIVGMVTSTATVSLPLLAWGIFPRDWDFEFWGLQSKLKTFLNHAQFVK